MVSKRIKQTIGTCLAHSFNELGLGVVNRRFHRVKGFNAAGGGQDFGIYYASEFRPLCPTTSIVTAHSELTTLRDEQHLGRSPEAL